MPDLTGLGLQPISRTLTLKMRSCPLAIASMVALMALT